METKTVKISLELPEGTSDQGRENAHRAAREAAVLALWDSADISTRHAAAELDLAYQEFLDLLASRGIAIVRDSDPASLEAVRLKLAAGA